MSHKESKSTATPFINLIKASTESDMKSSKRKAKSGFSIVKTLDSILNKGLSDDKRKEVKLSASEKTSMCSLFTKCVYSMKDSFDGVTLVKSSDHSDLIQAKVDNDGVTDYYVFLVRDDLDPSFEDMKLLSTFTEGAKKNTHKGSSVFAGFVILTDDQIASQNISCLGEKSINYIYNIQDLFSEFGLEIKEDDTRSILSNLYKKVKEVSEEKAKEKASKTSDTKTTSSKTKPKGKVQAPEESDSEEEYSDPEEETPKSKFASKSKRVVSDSESDSESD